MAALITTVPLLITSLIARFVYKLNLLEIFGLFAGASTDPPALSFAIKMVGNDSPAVVYAGVYPLTMFLRILVAQLLILPSYSIRSKINQRISSSTGMGR